jgi:hypothetical protein
LQWGADFVGSVRQEWCFRRKPPPSVARVAASSGFVFLLRALLRVTIAARGSKGENLVLCGCIATASLVSYPSWRRRIWRPVPACGSGGVALCIAGVVVHLEKCWQGGAEGSWGVASVGALGAVVISVTAGWRCCF